MQSAVIGPEWRLSKIRGDLIAFGQRPIIVRANIQALGAPYDP
jgi:hypothetical protein